MSKGKVFIVEDEVLIAETVRNKLLKLGYEVMGMAMTGEEAVPEVLKTQPDIILMDIRLAGEMDGIDTAEIIQQRFDVPIIFVTAFTDENTIERVKQIAPYGYIVKPYQMSDLSISLDLALHRHAAEKKRRQSDKTIQRALNQVGEGLVLTDPKGNIAFLNGVAEQVTGWGQERAFGKPFTDVVLLSDVRTDDFDDAALANPIVAALASQNSVHLAAQLANVSNKALNTAIVASAAPVEDEKGLLSGAIFTFKVQEAPAGSVVTDTIGLNDMFELQDGARKQIASDLHEGIAQILSAAKMNLDGVQAGADQNELHLQTARRLLTGAVERVRRMAQNVMPSTLSDFGLITAVDNFVKRLSTETEAHVTFHHAGFENRAKSSTDFNVFKIVHDIVHFLVRYAGATTCDIGFELVENSDLIATILHNCTNSVVQSVDELHQVPTLNEAFTRIRVSRGEISVEGSDDGVHSITIIMTV